MTARCVVGCAPICATCKRRKAPAGRSVALEMAGSLCDDDGCRGYRDAPTPCDLWPGEEREPTPAAPPEAIADAGADRGPR